MRSKTITAAFGVLLLSGCGAILGLGEREPLVDADASPGLPEGAASIAPAPEDASRPEVLVDGAGRPDALDASGDALDGNTDAPLDARPGDACACARGCNATGECLDEVVSLAQGRAHACLVRGDGRLFCVGSNRLGQIAGATQDSVEVCAGEPCTTTWKRIDLDDAGRKVRFRSVASQADATCALSEDGDVFCFGDNASGQCGLAPAPTAPPTKVDFAGAKVKELAVGGHHACAIVRTAAAGTPNVRCWGANENGELGQGGLPPGAGATSALPLEVPGLAARKIEVSSLGDDVSGGTSCALSNAGVAACWGNNAELQSSALSAVEVCAGGAPCFLLPTEWSGAGPTLDIQPARLATCALQPGAGGVGTALSCRDRTGIMLTMPGCQPALAPADLPITLPLAQNPTRLVGSYKHFCATAASGVYCFGLNAHGELGVPGSDACGPVAGGARRVVPTHVKDSAGDPIRAKLLALGRDATLAYTRDGDLYGWGNAAGGQLGAPPLAQPPTNACVSGQCLTPTKLTLPAYP